MYLTTLISTNTISDYEGVVNGFYEIIEKLIDKLPASQAAAVLITIVIVVVLAIVACFFFYHYLSYKKKLADVHKENSKAIYERDRIIAAKNKEIEAKNKEIEDLHKQLNSYKKISDKKSNRKGGAR